MRRHVPKFRDATACVPPTTIDAQLKSPIWQSSLAQFPISRLARSQSPHVLKAVDAGIVTIDPVQL